MSIKDHCIPQIGSVYGALDSGVGSTGRPMSAHEIRVLERGVNRLMSKSTPLCNIMQGSELSSLTGAGTHNTALIPNVATANAWVRTSLGQRICVKSPWHRRAVIDVTARVGGFGIDQTAFVQVCTTAEGFDPGLKEGHPRMLKMVGDASGGWQDFGPLTGIPLGDGDVERFEFFMMTSTAGALADAAVVGTNQGTVTLLTANTFDGAATTWLSTIADGNFNVQFTDASYIPIPGIDLHKIVLFLDADTIAFEPVRTDAEIRTFLDFIYNGGVVSYQIIDIPTIRLASISLRTEAMTQ